MEAKTGKRIVSKGDYMRLLSKKAFLGVGGIGAGIVAITCGMFAALGYSQQLHLGYIGIIVLCVGYILFGYITRMCLKQAATLDTGVPLTSANTAHLSAADTLIRPSTEPLQAQEAVLLRAAARRHETPPEELVRAADGQE